MGYESFKDEIRFLLKKIKIPSQKDEIRFLEHRDFNKKVNKLVMILKKKIINIVCLEEIGSNG